MLLSHFALSLGHATINNDSIEGDSSNERTASKLFGFNLFRARVTLAIEFMFQMAAEHGRHRDLAGQGGGTLGAARADRLRQLVARRNLFGIAAHPVHCDARRLHAIGGAFIHAAMFAAYGFYCLRKVKSCGFER